MGARDFQDKLLSYIGQLCTASPRSGGPILPDTPLFEGGLVDSRRVVDLMDFVERELGITIPDDKLSMEYFRSPAQIARAFAGGSLPSAPAPEAPLLVFGNSGRRASREGVDEMVARGEIVPDGTGSVSLQGSAFIVHRYFSRLFEDLARRECAAPRRYATMLPLTDMQRTDYFKSFPQHATFCTCLHRDEQTLQAFIGDVKAGQAASSAAGKGLEPPSLMLSSAVCYHCYREYAGRTLEAPLTVLTAQGQCFRHERGSFKTLDRCYEFTMREIVLLGEHSAIDKRRMRLLKQVVDVAASLGMSGTVERATDYFYRDDVDGRARTVHQHANALKYELRVRIDEAGGSLAVASFNLHEDYFGRAFGIQQADGSPSSTGCVAFGIERWVSAFLAYNGPSPSAWPRDVLLGGALDRS